MGSVKICSDFLKDFLQLGQIIHVFGTVNYSEVNVVVFAYQQGVIVVSKQQRISSKIKKLEGIARIFVGRSINSTLDHTKIHVHNMVFYSI